ncbi:MAG: SpoIIE family protein phosphatase [Acidimicrobiales bacterium]
MTGTEHAQRSDSGSGLGSQLRDLARVLAAVATAGGTDEIASVATGRTLVALGADAASLCIVDQVDGQLRVAGTAGIGEEGLGGWPTIAPEKQNAVAEAARTASVVTAASSEEIRRRWPDRFESSERERSVAAVPLLAAGRHLGVLALSFPSRVELSGDDREYLRAVADTCALALERARATEAAIDAATRLAFLADASAALSSSLDYESTLRVVADLAVPKLADWCAIDLLEDGRLRRVAISHLDPVKLDLAAELQERFPTDMNAPSGAPAVARTGQSELIVSVDDELLDRLGVDDELRRVVRQLQLHSALTVALKARDRTLGILAFVYAESRRHYRADDVTLAEDLARRAAVAIDNSQLYTETLQVALQLQHAVQPAGFPELTRFEVGVHYSPAGRTQVGGDFYDAIELPDGRLVVLVGDVMGRGVTAAAWMARLRSAVRAFVAVDPDARSVCRRLDRLFELDSPDGQIFTMVYAVLDPDGTATIVTAGHLPPIVVDAHGNTRIVELPRHPPFGVGARDRPAAVVQLAAGDVVLLYTDGLVERRGEDIDDGIARLVDLAATVGGEVSDRSVTELADRLRSAGHDDDVTVLAARQRDPGGG